MRPCAASPRRSGRTRSATATWTIRRLAAYFDRAAFVRPANNIGRFGNAGVGTLIGPGHQRLLDDAGQGVPLAGRTRASAVEIAFSNLFNIENLDVTRAPQHHVERFRRVTSTQTVDQAGPRTIQFSLRVAF